MPYFAMAGKTMKNLFTKPATRLYPIQKRQYHPASRGHVAINGETCIFCGICQKKCPTDAITVARKEKTWEIDRLKCIACGCCADACPKSSLSMNNAYSPPLAVAETDKSRFLFKGPDDKKPDTKETSG